MITNLLSAIPWIGQSLVESKNLTEYSSIVSTASLLPTIGTVSAHALKKGNKSQRLDKQEYLSIPPSFLAFFAGLIDGDGYIKITRTTKGYVQMKLVISIHLNDISTIQYIYSVLNLGIITIYRDIRRPTCTLTINQTELQEIIFPLLMHHNIFFLTDTRRYQYDTAIYILNKGIKLYEGIPVRVPILFKLPETAPGYKNLHFFQNWIVGFTVAEGSFLIQSSDYQYYQYEGCFQLKQKIPVGLFEAFKLVFNTNSNIYIEPGYYNQFSVSSKIDVQNVINFFSLSGLHPLVGLKNIQYLKWLCELKTSIRYKNLSFPDTPSSIKDL